MGNILTINDLLSASLEERALSDEELAAVYGGTWGDAVGHLAAGVMGAGAAFLGVAMAPISVPLVMVGIGLTAAGAGLALGYGAAVW